VLAVAVIVAGLVGQALMGALPSGNRVALARASAGGATAPSTRAWYDRDTADGLAAELDVALEGTDWCAGWRIVQQYSYGGASASVHALVDEGSNRGVDQPATVCTDWAQVVVLYGYTSSTSTREDNAELWVDASSPTLAADLARHAAFDVTADDLLREDRGQGSSDVIGNAIAALPLALAEQGELDPLSVEPVDAGSDGAVTFDDAEGEGGLDVLAANQTVLLVGALVILSGFTLLCMAWGQVPARWFPPDAADFATARAPGSPGAGAPPPQSQPRFSSPRRALKAQLRQANQANQSNERGGSS
jgi:hypothetical protein